MRDGHVLLQHQHLDHSAGGHAQAHQYLGHREDAKGKVAVYTALVGSDLKGNPDEKEGSRDPGKEGALEAWSEVGLLSVPREAIVPQRPPTEVLHVDFYLCH